MRKHDYLPFEVHYFLSANLQPVKEHKLERKQLQYNIILSSSVDNSTSQPDNGQEEAAKQPSICISKPT